MGMTKESLIQMIREEIHALIQEQSPAAAKAKELGLFHRGFGTYSTTPDGPIVFKTVKGQLAKVKDVGRWQKYRAEKALRDKQDGDFNINTKISNQSKHVTDVVYKGDRIYFFRYGGELMKKRFTKQEFAYLVDNHLSVKTVLEKMMKEIERRSKLKAHRKRMR
jgi:hypothetical protein